jgi:hypothetical protein
MNKPPDIEELYKVAIDTHKHYDTLSLTIVAGIIGVAAGSISIYKPDIFPKYSGFVFLCGALIDLFLFYLYWKCSNLALVARKVSRAIEEGELIGVSTVFSAIANTEYGDDGELKKKYTPVWNWKGIRACILYFSLLLVFINLVLFRATVA